VPTPLVAIVSAAVLAAGGVGLGGAIVGSGGTSQAPSARVGPLAADPTAPPPHRGFVYQAPQQPQTETPGLGRPAGQAPGGSAPATGKSGYVAKGEPKAPLGRLPAAQPSRTATTWPLYLSGSDLLQPDVAVANRTDQSIGPVLGGACGQGLAGRWTAPTTAVFPFHGPLPGLLHVAASGPVTLTISLTQSKYGGTCSVLSTTTVTADGTAPVAFTLPRVDVDLPAGQNIALVVSTDGSARIESSAGALSYVIAPTAPQ
jgi:hypothetical protein